MINSRIRIKGKKAGFEEIQADIPIYFITGLIILLFFVLFNLPSCGKSKPGQFDVSADVKNLKTDFDTLTLLRMPVEAGGKEVQFSDLVSAKAEVMRVYEDKYKEKYGMGKDSDYVIDKPDIMELPAFNDGDKIKFLGSEVKLEGSVKDKFHAYLVMAKKVDDLAAKYDAKYSDCYAMSISKGNMKISYGSNNLFDDPSNPRFTSTYIIPDYGNQNIIFELQLLSSSMGADAGKKCKEYRNELAYKEQTALSEGGQR